MCVKLGFSYSGNNITEGGRNRMLSNEINRGSRTASVIVFTPHQILFGSEMEKNEMGCA